MPLPPIKYSNRIKLSRQELRGISKAINRDFAPRSFDIRPQKQAKTGFFLQELQTISQEISREYAPSKEGMQSKLVLLPISPKRLHAYWHLPAQLSKQQQQKAEPQAMVLRIYAEIAPTAPKHTETPSESSWFDIQVIADHGHQNIALPDHRPEASAIHYRAVLGEIDADQHFVPLSYSNTTASVEPGEVAQSNALANTIIQSIMPIFCPASSVGNGAYGQGKSTSR